MIDPKGGVAKVTCPTFEAMGQIPMFHRTYFLLSKSHVFSMFSMRHVAINPQACKRRLFYIYNDIFDAIVNSYTHFVYKLQCGHSIECITHAGLLNAFNVSCTSWPWPLTFWPNRLLIVERGFVMDYLCGKLVIAVSAVWVLSCGQTDRQNLRITDIRERRKPCFHYRRVDRPCWWPVNSRLVETARPSTRPLLTGNRNWSPVNSGRGLGPSTRVVETGLYTSK